MDGCNVRTYCWVEHVRSRKTHRASTYLFVETSKWEWTSGHGWGAGGEGREWEGQGMQERWGFRGAEEKKRLYLHYLYVVIIRIITFKDPSGACDQSWHAFQWIRTMSASSVLPMAPDKVFMPCSASVMSVMTMLAALLSVMLQLTMKLLSEIMLVRFLNLLQSKVLFYKVFYTRLA